MKAISIKVTKEDGQDKNEDLIIIELENDNEYEVQRVNGVFNQMLGCIVRKNGKEIENWDDECDFVTKTASEF